MPTVCYERAICDQCVIEHRLDERVDTTVQRQYPGWKRGEEFPCDHPVWDLHRRAWDLCVTNCLTITDFEGIEVVSLCQTHLTEHAEAIQDG